MDLCVVEIDNLMEEVPGLLVAPGVLFEPVQDFQFLLILAKDRVHASLLPFSINSLDFAVQSIQTFVLSVCLSQSIEILHRVQTNTVHSLPDVMESIRIDLSVDSRVTIELLERGENVLSIVDEIDHHRIRLLRIDAVQPRKCLNSSNPR